jgi:hypothetical protein
MSLRSIGHKAPSGTPAHDIEFTRHVPYLLGHESKEKGRTSAYFCFEVAGLTLDCGVAQAGDAILRFGFD